MAHVSEVFFSETNNHSRQAWQNVVDEDTKLDKVELCGVLTAFLQSTRVL